ncbi:hypothetical protein EJB05_08558, partial [Eragrostis curvula]
MPLGQADDLLYLVISSPKLQGRVPLHLLCCQIRPAMTPWIGIFVPNDSTNEMLRNFTHSVPGDPANRKVPNSVSECAMMFYTAYPNITSTRIPKLPGGCFEIQSDESMNDIPSYPCLFAPSRATSNWHLRSRRSIQRIITKSYQEGPKATRIFLAMSIAPVSGCAQHAIRDMNGARDLGDCGMGAVLGLPAARGLCRGYRQSFGFD